MRSASRLTLLLLTLLFLSSARAEEGLQESLEAVSRPLLAALNLIGTPYRMGGRSPDTGLDCSGLVRHVYKQTHGIELPHNAREISLRGELVERNELRPGDLVFFNTLGRPFSHVGIYKGDGKFVHASSRSNRRVTVSDMRDSYWSRRFDGARRLLPGLR
jgi:cell wall-associated NlpC family hydrolase